MSIIIEGINKREFSELLLGEGFMDAADINNFFGHKIKDIPPHRLIDADELLWEMRKKNDFGELTAKSAMRAVKYAPTIIEAEGVKE